MSSLFINILILERRSGMKSFSAFITEKEKTTGNMKFPGDDQAECLQG